MHALVLDGVFARTAALHFHPTCRLAALDVEEVLATVEPRIARLLERRGRGAHDGEGSASDVWAEEEAVEPGRCPARWNGVDLHAGLVVPAEHRGRLERRCRYALRQPWRDGTTDVVFDPVEFLARLAVLVPRPRINLIL